MKFCIFNIFKKNEKQDKIVKTYNVRQEENKGDEVAVIVLLSPQNCQLDGVFCCRWCGEVVEAEASCQKGSGL